MNTRSVAIIFIIIASLFCMPVRAVAPGKEAYFTLTDHDKQTFHNATLEILGNPSNAQFMREKPPGHMIMATVYLDAEIPTTMFLLYDQNQLFFFVHLGIVADPYLPYVPNLMIYDGMIDDEELAGVGIQQAVANDQAGAAGGSAGPSDQQRFYGTDS